ncbi:MAG: sigma-70 family RNA polymerase sigma factor [Gammaproteobacteria bacterium]|nr:sigma-70 family RNA polymerase sigma factor [Gammaproteobacteria bacterium]
MKMSHNLWRDVGAFVRSRNNNKIDIANLYQEYGDSLRRFVAKKLSPGDVDDVMHDTFIRVLCLTDGYELRRPRPFLFQIATNLILDHFRARRAHVYENCEGSDAAQQAVDNVTPEQTVYARQRLEVLQHAIAELPPRCREVFLLHKFENESHAAIAAKLGISVNMVEKHVIRALAHCRERLAALD